MSRKRYPIVEAKVSDALSCELYKGLAMVAVDPAGVDNLVQVVISIC